MTAGPLRSVLWRTALLGLLLLALWDPRVGSVLPGVDLVVVLDDSLSMRDRPAGTYWTLISDAVAKLPPGSRFGLVRYGANPQIEVFPDWVRGNPVRSVLAAQLPPRRLAVDRTSTSTEKALRAALRLAEGRRKTIILLVSDGNATSGRASEALRIAKASGIGVYWYDPGSPEAQMDSWIEAIHVPQVARSDQRIPVTVTIGSTVAANGSLVVSDEAGPISKTELRISADQPNWFQFWLEPRRPGWIELEARLDIAHDPTPENNRRSRLIQIEGRAPVLFVSSADRRSRVVQGLVDGGWAIKQIRPSLFPVVEQELHDFAAIVLDDIGISDMSTAAWSDLDQAVRHAGLGLVVLGGPHSFAAGAYRNSRLEALLPVTAEAAEPKGRLAVQFVVDKSGTMDRGAEGVSRFDYARLAVTQTIRSLERDDLVGLVFFDARVREAVPLRTKTALQQTIETAWEIRPAGGTVLEPALRLAVDKLSDVAADQRLLILLTDGFLSAAEDLEPLRLSLADANIDVISVVIGDNEQVAPLQRLSSAGGNRLLRVDEPAELPRLIRAEVELRRNPARLGPVVPQQTLLLPFLPSIGTWPKLDGYMVTKARSAARIYLSADRGDPLLAMQHVGTARVVVLPGGLGAWADEWPHWPSWGRFIGGLVDWAAARSIDLNVRPRIEHGPDALLFAVDAVDRNLDWLAGATAEATVFGPTGQNAQAVLKETAPGRFEGRVELTGIGQYWVAMRIGDEMVRRAVLRTAEREFFPVRRAVTELADLTKEDLVTIWLPGADLTDGLERADGSIRVYVVALSALLYILFLIGERIDLGIRHFTWRFITNKFRNQYHPALRETDRGE